MGSCTSKSSTTVMSPETRRRKEKILNTSQDDIDRYHRAPRREFSYEKRRPVPIQIENSNTFVAPAVVPVENALEIPTQTPRSGTTSLTSSQGSA